MLTHCYNKARAHDPGFARNYDNWGQWDAYTPTIDQINHRFQEYRDTETAIVEDASGVNKDLNAAVRSMTRNSYPAIPYPMVPPR